MAYAAFDIKLYFMPNDALPKLEQLFHLVLKFDYNNYSTKMSNASANQIF